MKLFKMTKFLIFVIFFSNLLFSGCSENSNLNNNSNQISSQENSKLNGGIYLNENMEKHRKSRLSAESSSKNRNSNLNKSTNRKNALPNQENPVEEEPSPALFQRSQPVSEKPVDLPKSGPYVYEGWVKYFKYTNEALTIFTPKEFIKNPAFYEQRKFFPKADFTKPNSAGVYDYIRNQNYFYLTFFPGYFVFNQSKKVKIDLFNFNF